MKNVEIPEDIFMMLVRFANDPQVVAMNADNELFESIKRYVNTKAEKVAARTNFGILKNPRATKEARDEALEKHKRYYAKRRENTCHTKNRTVSHSRS